jgi:hypothetical protein
MPVNRNLIRTVVAVVGTAGPVVAKYLREHPEITQSVNDSVTKLLQRRGSGPDAILQTVAVVREQVDYLRGSADDAAERTRAAEWARTLDNLEHAATMLRGGASRAELKALRARVDVVRGQVLAAFIAEQAEDAEQRRLEG